MENKNDEILTQLTSTSKLPYQDLKFEDVDLTEADASDEELIFGKYKTMEDAFKAYQEGLSAQTKVAELEKELKEYQKQAQTFEEEAIARDKGFTDRFEMALKFDVKKKELDNYMIAASYVLSPHQRLSVSKLINECRDNCNRNDLIKIRRFFSPEIIALVSEDVALYKHIRQFEYENTRQQEKAARFNRKLEEFRKLNREWAASEFYDDLITQALELSDGQVDLDELKKIIDKIEADAVKKFKKNASIEKENSAVQDLLSVSEGSKPKFQGKKWLTKKDFYKLTPEQEAAKYDEIVEQIRLENEGLLPRMLTK